MADQWACLLRNNDVHRSYNHFHQIWWFFRQSRAGADIFWLLGRGAPCLSCLNASAKVYHSSIRKLPDFFGCPIDNKGFLPSMRCGWQNQKKKMFLAFQWPTQKLWQSSCSTVCFPRDPHVNTNWKHVLRISHTIYHSCQIMNLAHGFLDFNSSRFFVYMCLQMHGRVCKIYKWMLKAPPHWLAGWFVHGMMGLIVLNLILLGIEVGTGKEYCRVWSCHSPVWMFQGASCN